jgi:hypothetical protein
MRRCVLLQLSADQPGDREAIIDRAMSPNPSIAWLEEDEDRVVELAKVLTLADQMKRYVRESLKQSPHQTIFHYRSEAEREAVKQLLVDRSTHFVLHEEVGWDRSIPRLAVIIARGKAMNHGSLTIKLEIADDQAGGC